MVQYPFFLKLTLLLQLNLGCFFFFLCLQRMEHQWFVSKASRSFSNLSLIKSISCFLSMTDKDVHALQVSSPTSCLRKPTSKTFTIMLTLLTFLIFSFWLLFCHRYIILYLNLFPAHHQVQFSHSWGFCLIGFLHSSLCWLAQSSNNFLQT